LEADFQREYGLDLSVEFPRLMWRRFRVLVRGLSGDSVLVARSSGKTGEEIITDPAVAEHMFQSLR
jgi:hypothetical protein